MQVVEGIYQISLPLPFPLRIVHVYLLHDGHGWTCIDTGLNYAEGRAAWQAALAELRIDVRDIRRIILTHAHPDHYGMAGWLAQQCGVEVELSGIEYDFVQATWLSEGELQHAAARFFEDYGMPRELGLVVDQDIAALRAMTLPAPRMRLIEAGMELEIGKRRFRLIHTPGHSDGHLVLYCAAEQLMLCGDAVLTKITPNIGLWSWGEKNPLGHFMHSLELLTGVEVDLALPGHGPLITNFRQRLTELREHHEQRLEQIKQCAGNGKDAYTICTQVFPVVELTSHQVRFAMAETLAHLVYLEERGEIGRVEGEVPMFVKR